MLAHRDPTLTTGVDQLGDRKDTLARELDQLACKACIPELSLCTLARRPDDLTYGSGTLAVKTYALVRRLETLEFTVYTLE